MGSPQLKSLHQPADHSHSAADEAKPFGFSQLRRTVFPVAALAAISTLAGFETARFHAATPWSSPDTVQASRLAPISSGARAVATLDLAAIAHLTPQQQAETSLERASARDLDSLDFIDKNVAAWRGHLQNTDRLFDLVHNALNSNDLRVRSSALEIDLAANNLDKSPASVARLSLEVRENPADRSWTLWRLGALGNRGVQPNLVLAQLLTYVHDRDEETRYWAVEGLAMLGTDDTIDPLLDTFAHDPSARVRKRAGCDLAQSGMFTKEQRLATVPNLLNLFDDDALDSSTRGWIYGALRLITGAELGNDSDAWRKWWANRDSSSRKHPLHRSGLLFA
jgi:HEAT repeat protein